MPATIPNIAISPLKCSAPEFMRSKNQKHILTIETGTFRPEYWTMRSMHDNLKILDKNLTWKSRRDNTWSDQENALQKE